MNKCENCIHNGVCKHEETMKDLAKRVEDVMNTHIKAELAYSNFDLEIKCKSFEKVEKRYKHAVEAYSVG